MSALQQQLVSIAEEFGVDVVQVRRDHLISHLLAALSAAAGDQVLFFGGTALARTHLVHGRLSEDLDLVSRSPRQVVAPLLEAALPRAALRSHGRLRWDPALSSVRDVDAASLVSADGLRVRLQLLTAYGIAPWPRSFVSWPSGTKTPLPPDCWCQREALSLPGRPQHGPTGALPATCSTCGHLPGRRPRWGGGPAVPGARADRSHSGCLAVR